MFNERRMSSSQRRSKITWDEDVIAEHDKERGQRQKIDEPDTPFLYYDPEGDEVSGKHPDLAAMLAEVSAKLEKSKDEEPRSRSSPPASDDFAAKRAAHYDEFARLQQWRETSKDEDDEDTQGETEQ